MLWTLSKLQLGLWFELEMSSGIWKKNIVYGQFLYTKDKRNPNEDERCSRKDIILINLFNSEWQQSGSSYFRKR